MEICPRFELRLLGVPGLRESGLAIHLPRRKALGLLAYLAFGKRQYHRDTLAALFWPDHDDSHARGSLRRLLSELRKILVPELLPVDDDRVGPLDLSRIWVDIEEFQALLAQVRMNQRLGAGQVGGGLSAGTTAAETTEELLRRAVELYRGDFLAGFSLGKCGQFSDWQFLQGEYLRRELCAALEQLVELCERRAELAEGIACGRRLVEADPLNEEAHCALMRLHAAGGQRQAALRQYRLCQKLLKEELGLEPEEATVQQYEALRHSRPLRVPASGVLRRPGRSSRGAARLAVLPFKSLAEEGGQEWFSDGMTDALITELSRRGELEVIGYASSAHYQNTEKSLRQVAAELEVGHLLEGAVLKAGEEVRISAKLIEAVSNRHVWAESYRGSFSDLLELQERIASSIATQVIGELVAGPEKAASPEIHAEALEACMMGDYFLRTSQSEEEINKAKDCYRKAIDQDPRCADAYAGLAFTYFSLGGYGRDVTPSQDIRNTVGMFIQRALEIDPDNVRAHMVLGGLRLEWNWDWVGAEQVFQEVLRINPNHIETLNWYSFLRMAFCRFDEMFALLQIAYRLDPLNLVTLVHLHRYYCAILQYRRSLEMLDRIDELYPGRCIISAYRAWVYVLMGRYETAISLGEAIVNSQDLRHVPLLSCLRLWPGGAEG